MSINTSEFYDLLEGCGVEFYTGVPDSLLKDFCLCVDDRVPGDKHIIAANEGNAIALAAGYYLANKSIPLVYMQNSGLGNAVNPLLSLCDPEVYSIPMLLMIGWRGEPGVKDEPQHIKQGKIQLDLLDTLNVPYVIISKDDKSYASKVSSALTTARNEDRPVALLMRKGVFEIYGAPIPKVQNHQMLREEALEVILDNLDKNTIIVSTTGKTSREIFEIREKRGQSHQQEFLTVGSMGHCSSIALGIALAEPGRQVVCIDGDGAMLMHLGILTTIASTKPMNFRHILMNNEVHESVGGQATAAKKVDLSAIVDSLGDSKMFKVQTRDELDLKINNFLESEGPSFLEIKISPGSRKDLGRPTIKPIENKIGFMKFLER
tara:strand:+ start:29234 stop:30364 length:1131 start_codon:yes stop_codon:yes gene_type:complete